MALIENLLVHFRTQLNYQTNNDLDYIKDDSIVFVQDSGEIVTHDTVYKSVNWTILEDSMVSVPNSIPTGVRIVDGSGNIVTIDKYDINSGMTGLSISDGTHKIVMAVLGYGAESDINVGVDFDRFNVKSGKFGTYQSLNGTSTVEAPRYNILADALQDYNTEGNTTAFIQAIYKTSRPSEVTASVTASSYSAGIYEQGKWDLPSVGHFKMIADNKDEIVRILTLLSNNGLECRGLVKILGTHVWTSTIADDQNVWVYDGTDNSFVQYMLQSNRMVLPIHVIE